MRFTQDISKPLGYHTGMKLCGLRGKIMKKIIVKALAKKTNCQHMELLELCKLWKEEKNVRKIIVLNLWQMSSTSFFILQKILLF